MDKPHSPLSHLSPAEIDEVTAKYYSDQKIHDILAEYSINLNPNKLYKHLPLQTIETLCRYCAIPLVQKPLSRANSKRGYVDKRDDLPYCPTCGHLDLSTASYSGAHKNMLPRECDCERCIKEFNEAKQAIIDGYNAELPGPKGLDELDTTSLIFLGAVSLQMERCVTVPPTLTAQNFSPTSKLNIQIVKHLMREGLLEVTGADNEAFTKTPDGDIYKVHKERLHYRVRELEGREYSGRDLHSECMKRATSLFDRKTILEVYRIWGHEELKSHYATELKKHFHSTGRPKKATEAIDFLLENFGLGEGVYLISYAFKNCRWDFNEGKFNNIKHATNSVPHSIMNLGKWLLRKKKETSTYSLPPQTDNQLRKVLTRLLKSSPDAMRVVVNEHSLRNLAISGIMEVPLGEEDTHLAASSRCRDSLEGLAIGALMKEMRWSLEMVSEISGVDVERLFSIVNNNATPTSQENELFKALKALASASS